MQLGILESIKDILYLKPLYLFGLAMLAVLLYQVFRKEKKLPKFRTVLGAMLMFYYLCIVFSHIVGIPTLNELMRIASLGEPFFNPNISLTPLVNGISLEFILNIFCFVPLGFLCPFMSRTFESVKNAALLGFGVSLAIEISQLFTMYRATDINDLIANSLGALIGFLCFKLIATLGMIKQCSQYRVPYKNDSARFLPVLTVLLAFVSTFLFEF